MPSITLNVRSFISNSFFLNLPLVSGVISQVVKTKQVMTNI
jgi:hypothetical protein